MTYVPAADRYERCATGAAAGAGSTCPLVSLGLWHNFGGVDPLERSRAIVRRAFDLGITHFDLANNYGPPYGSAEETFGKLLRDDLASVPRRARHLDEGGLRHVAGAVRRVGLAQVPAREPRPEPAAHGARVRRHLLLAPVRPVDAARGDDGRARHRGAAGEGAVRGHLLVHGRADAGGGADHAGRSGRRSSSTSRPTRWSTVGSRAGCSTCSKSRESAASPSRRSARAS